MKVRDEKKTIAKIAKQVKSIESSRDNNNKIRISIVRDRLGYKETNEY